MLYPTPISHSTHSGVPELIATKPRKINREVKIERAVKKKTGQLNV